MHNDEIMKRNKHNRHLLTIFLARQTKKLSNNPKKTPKDEIKISINIFNNPIKQVEALHFWESLLANVQHGEITN